jgi:hypothetical protein
LESCSCLAIFAVGVEAQLRLLARQQRDTLLQLEAAREAEARTARHWQVGWGLALLFCHIGVSCSWWVKD